MRLAAIYRSALYSPGRHRTNDAAIMDAVTAQMTSTGWTVERVGENDVEAGILPPADLYLNMCQGIAGSERLCQIEESGALMLNRPSSVLRCHRHRLMEILGSSGLAFPRTVIVSTAASADTLAALDTEFVWVKRGDVHAQEAADVVRARREEIGAALAGFASRGIDRVALQEHVGGEVIKFYGVSSGTLFHAFGENGVPFPATHESFGALRELAATAAAAVGLSIYGGDAVVAPGRGPVLIDLNDWPSFAPIRDAAAVAIAHLVEAAAMERSIT